MEVMQVERKVNLVVIGSGGAGMAAAVTAMQNGLDKIVVLEKRSFFGWKLPHGRRPFGLTKTEDKAGYCGNRRGDIPWGDSLPSLQPRGA